jgi:hypothetical protein
VVDPWISAISELCEKLRVDIADFSLSDHKQSAFLGAGANGRVFKLSNGHVIKIVVGHKSDDVEKEYLLMRQYGGRADIGSIVFPVIENTYHSGVVCGIVAYAGYVLAHEGTKLSLPVSDKVKTELADALHGLHCGDVIHGDPRIDNALMLNGTLKWIDFRQSDAPTTKTRRRRDVQILLESVGGSSLHASDEIEAYVNNSTEEIFGLFCWWIG